MSSNSESHAASPRNPGDGQTEPLRVFVFSHRPYPLNCRVNCDMTFKGEQLPDVERILLLKRMHRTGVDDAPPPMPGDHVACVVVHVARGGDYRSYCCRFERHPDADAHAERLIDKLTEKLRPTRSVLVP